MLLYALNTFGRTLTSLYAKTTQNAASIKHNKDAKSHTKVDSQNRFEFSRPMFFWCDHQIREKARRSAKLTWPHFSNSHVRQNQETYLSRDAFQVSLPKAYFRYFLNVFNSNTLFISIDIRMHKLGLKKCSLFVLLITPTIYAWLKTKSRIFL